MKLHQIIQKNKYVAMRHPIKLMELEDFVNSYEGRERDYSKSAVRAIFMGNGDWYNFKYKSVGGGKYIPRELDTSKKILNKIAVNYMESGITLQYKLGLTLQNVARESWLIFEKKTAIATRYLSFFPELMCEYKEIDPSDVPIYKELMKLSVFSGRNRIAIKEYVRANNILLKDLVNWIKKAMAEKWIHGKIKDRQDINDILVLDGGLSDMHAEFEKILLEAIIYAR